MRLGPREKDKEGTDKEKNAATAVVGLESKPRPWYRSLNNMHGTRQKIPENRAPQGRAQVKGCHLLATQPS